MNIVLIGYRCSGKSSVARALAERTGMPVLDTDKLVERHAGKTVSELVTGGGWELFRGLEKRAVEEAAGLDGVIIASGGGAVLDHQNAALLRKNGWTVWLKAAAEVLRERMGKDEASGTVRPSLTGVDSLEEIRSVLESREAVYAAASDHVVDTEGRSPDDIAEEIQAAVKRFRGKK